MMTDRRHDAADGVWFVRVGQGGYVLTADEYEEYGLCCDLVMRGDDAKAVDRLRARWDCELEAKDGC
jgi:hypothetical protein